MTQKKTPEHREPLQSVAASAAEGTAPPHEGDYAEVIGAFKDDPMLDAMMENIRRRRREIDADDSIE